MVVNELLKHLFGIENLPVDDETLYFVEFGWTNSKKEIFSETYLFRHDLIPKEILNSRINNFYMERCDTDLFDSITKTKNYNLHKKDIDFYFNELESFYYLSIDIIDTIDTIE